MRWSPKRRRFIQIQVIQNPERSWKATDQYDLKLLGILHTKMHQHYPIYILCDDFWIV